MPNIIICLTIALSSFYIFSLSYRITGVNRAFTNIPLSIFESSIPIHQEADKFIAYFNQQSLNLHLTAYFDSKITYLCDSYSLDLYYYYPNDGTFCKGKRCQGVEVTLKVKFDVFNEVQKTAKFYIQNNGQQLNYSLH